jgi:hypothetical protein
MWDAFGVRFTLLSHFEGGHHREALFIRIEPDHLRETLTRTNPLEGEVRIVLLGLGVPLASDVRDDPEIQEHHLNLVGQTEARGREGDDPTPAFSTPVRLEEPTKERAHDRTW